MQASDEDLVDGCGAFPFKWNSPPPSANRNLKTTTLQRTEEESSGIGGRPIMSGFDSAIVLVSLMSR